MTCLDGQLSTEKGIKSAQLVLVPWSSSLADAGWKRHRFASAEGRAGCAVWPCVSLLSRFCFFACVFSHGRTSCEGQTASPAPFTRRPRRTVEASWQMQRVWWVGHSGHWLNTSSTREVEQAVLNLTGARLSRLLRVFAYSCAVICG